MFKKIKEFVQSLEEDDEKRAEFIEAREKYISMKLHNPSLVLRNKQDLWPRRIVSLSKKMSTSMAAPKTYLCELSSYKKKFGAPDPSKVIQRRFNGKLVTGVLVIKEEDEGMYAISHEEEMAAQNRGDMSDVNLREGQDQEMFAAMAGQVSADSTHDLSPQMLLPPSDITPRGITPGRKKQKVLCDQEKGGESDAASDSGSDAPAPTDFLRSFQSSGKPATQSSLKPQNFNFLEARRSSPSKPSPPAPCETSAAMPSKLNTSEPLPEEEDEKDKECRPRKRQMEERQEEEMPEPQPKKASKGRENFKNPKQTTQLPAPEIMDSDLVLSPEAVKQFPSEDDAEEKAKEAKPKSGGRKSQKHIQAEDMAFLWSRQAELKMALVTLPEIEGKDGIPQFCQDLNTSLSSLQATISKKVTSTKRRKTSKSPEEPAALSPEMQQVVETAKAFQCLCSHLGMPKTNADDVKDIYLLLTDKGWTFPTVIVLKVCRLKLWEEMKFNKYAKVAACFKMSHALAGIMQKADEALGEPGYVSGQLLEGLVSKLAAMVPSKGSARAVLESVHAINLANLVAAFASCRSECYFSDQIKDQLQNLWSFFSFLSTAEGEESRKSLVTSADDALNAVALVLDCNATEHLLFSSLKQAAGVVALLSHIKGIIKRRAKKGDNPVILLELKAELDRQFDAMTASKLKQSDLAGANAFNSCDEIAQCWKTLYDRIQEASQDLPDHAAKLSEMQKEWKDRTLQLLRLHITFDLAPFLGQLAEDIASNKPGQTPPKWHVASLRGLLDVLHCAFLTHDFIGMISLKMVALTRGNALSDGESAQILKQWEDLQERLCKESLPDIDLCPKQVGAFGQALRVRIRSDVVAKAGQVQKDLQLQLLNIVGEEIVPEEAWDVSRCDQLLCLATGFPAELRARAEEVQEFAQVTKTFIQLSDKVTAFDEAIQKMKVEEKVPNTVIKALQDLNFGKMDKIPGILLGEQGGAEHKQAVTEGLKQIETWLEKKWDEDLSEKLATFVNPDSEALRTICSQMPDYGSVSLKDFSKAVKNGQVGEKAAKLKRKVEACLQWGHHGGLDVKFCKAASAIANQALALVSTSTVGLLVENKLWAEMTPALASTKGSKHAALHKQLVDTCSFIQNTGLEIPARLQAEMTDRIQSGRTSTK
ncbi:unnamed protein product [Durusdinium trenchii]|uniref:Uncharacterized protein n=1 Tax=Durusdinium trenchii TaxID=1381693 RepID=A0ABP0MBW6_9DINO